MFRPRPRPATLGRAGVGSGMMLQLPGFVALHRGGHNPSPWYFIIGGVVAVIAVLAALAIARYSPRLRRKLSAGRRSRRRTQATATAEARARALMSELCPHGWRAQITLFGPSDERPPDAPEGPRSQVALDWAELEHERRGVAVVRRVWAASIAEALDAMVADRRTDETLEQIERGAAIDGSLWPDV